MNFKTTKQRLFIIAPAVLAAIVILYSACQKQINTEVKGKDSFIEVSRGWFINDIVEKEKEMMAQPYSVLPSDDPVRRFARMRRLSELLNWNKAKEYSQYGISYVIVPVEQDVKPLSNKNFEAARSLAFYKDQSGKMHMNVIEIVSKKGGSLGDNIQETASVAFINKYVTKYNKLQSIDASVVFYDETYKRESSFQITNGLWAKASINFQNQSGAPKRRTVPLMLGRTTCGTCQSWYLVGFWYNLQTGAVVDYQILDEWDECTEFGPPQGYGNYPEPSATPPQECVTQNQAALDNLVNSATVENETLSIEVSSIDSLKKNKTIKWVILRGGPSFWRLVSTELGVVKLVDASINKWQWESLVHGSIAKEGIVIGGEVAVKSQTGTPSFTPGTPNILYAGMSLDFTIEYTATPIPCPPFDMIIPPVSVSYQANAIWPATP